MQKLHLDGSHISLQRFVELADSPVSITLAASIRERLVRAREIVARYAASDQPVYGLNTGLGGNLQHRIEAEDIPGFQASLLLARSAGVGPNLPEWISRAAWLSRIIGAARGASGLSLTTFDLMLAMAERGLAPAVPTYGSIGTSDLVLAAQMGASLIGQGEMWDNGNCRPAAEALRAHGIEPIELAPKDGLALANNSSLSIALAARALSGARSTMDLAQAITVLSGESYGMNLSIFEARIHALRPAAGQEQAAAWFRAALEGSSLYGSGAPRSIQDALSFRVVAPLFGTARNALALAEKEIEIELNGAADNPAVLIDTNEMLSTPNFHTPALALALDTLAIAHVHLATASAQRILKLMNPHLSGLPKYLSPVGGASAGLLPLQKTTASLLAEIRLHAQPASLDAISVSEMVEDVAPQTPLAARKLATQTELLQWLIAIEALVAAQAVDLRKPKSLGRVAKMLHSAIRNSVLTLHEDRATGPDVAAVRQAINADELRSVLANIGLTAL
ncbi:MAG: aromatic amino acid ammonia-lyase [Aestuariivirga sp.]|nr:aromatic amino acid ammonia-lyase [Aestuariivirga sp.]